MSNVARVGVFGLMALAIALSRLIEVEVRPQPLTVGARSEAAAPAQPGAASPSASPATAAAPAPAGPAPAAPAAQRTYVVQSGDVLGRISDKVYGTSRHWRLILEANRDLIPNESRLRPGLELRIPPAPK